MPLYIPWLTDTIKKRGVRYLLHHYLGQFFEEKLTLEQLSIDIYEGKGSIRNLALDVDGLNDELDFIPFTFLDGCSIEQISVEVPWSSLNTDACRVELDGAKFFCRLKTTADAAKHHCTESTLLSRSLMTSSMQMAEEIVTTEDDEDVHYHQTNSSTENGKDSATKKKDANQMFEGLEMFAQLIDSVLRRTKLTARNTLFQIQPHDEKEEDEVDQDADNSSDTTSRKDRNQTSRSSGEEFCEPTANSDTDDESHQKTESDKNQAKSTVEFFIRFFRCEEMIDQTRVGSECDPSKGQSSEPNDGPDKSPCAIPETVTKLLTLEDVEMRIDGVPVSNLIGKHTITIKFNGQKSEISIFSGSPLLAVISHKQLEIFFNVFDSSKGQDLDSCSNADRNQKPMRPEDYAKIENQLLESASFRNMAPNENSRISLGAFGSSGDSISNDKSSYYATSRGVVSIGSTARRWAPDNSSAYTQTHPTRDSEYGYQSPNSSTIEPLGTDLTEPSADKIEPSLDHIEAFSCELKLPGIWLCIIRAGQPLPPLIKPYADSINSFQTINKYIDNHIKVPHIRCLALKVALDITAAGTNLFLADLDVSEHLVDSSRMSPVLKLFHSEQANTPVNSSRYKASISKGKEITIDLLTRTRAMFDPTIIDRIVYDYRLVKLNRPQDSNSLMRNYRTASQTTLKRSHSPEMNLTLRGDRFKLELLCPIPDLTPDAHTKQTQLRPQSFIFDFKGMVLSWQSDKLTISSNELLAYVKTQPMQSDNDAVKFIESTSRGSDKIKLVLEPSPSDLDNAFSNDVEQALNESSMYDSIYVSQATESRLPRDPFQTKRKLVRASFQSQQHASNKPYGAQLSECDHEKILTPGDRQHLLDYLNQTVLATKLSLNLHLPVCRVEFEDKEQLDLIYNRFGNDFVFWQPRALTKVPDALNKQSNDDDDDIQFRRLRKLDNDDDDDQADQEEEDERTSTFSGPQGSQNSLHSVHNVDTSSSERYDNEATCKIIVDELFVKFNHQSCAASLKQELAAENFLLGVIIDVNKRPNTLLSLVADNLELSTDLETVLERNHFTDKNSVFALTAQIKRPTRLLKDIKLAIQLNNGLFNDFCSETYTRFWQSVNVTDEPILGYVAPQIITELHIDILNTSLMLVREDARPALLSIDELYMTSMVMERTSQVMLRLIADEVSLYMKRDRQGLETMKNYICLIDSGLIDLDVKFGQAGRLEFGVINNVITVRVCQDSLNALCKLFNVLIRSSSQQKVSPAAASANPEVGKQPQTMETGQQKRVSKKDPARSEKTPAKSSDKTKRVGSKAPLVSSSRSKKVSRKREMNLLADAMNDYSITAPTSAAQAARAGRGRKEVDSRTATNGNRSSGDEERDEDDENDVADKSSNDGSAHHTDSGEHDDEHHRADYGSDSDAPPVFQQTASSLSSEDGRAQARKGRRDPNACLLDESNPMLGDMFSQPLMPSSSKKLNTNPDGGLIMNSSESTDRAATHSLLGSQDGDDEMMDRRAMDESGFFVIGDDDVGAGIMDKKQHEPVVRKLIDGPINIIDNHFKMTRPRTIPEMLANSLERYVLEEMTLVVNLYGGHDFDDEHTSSATNEDTANSTADMNDQAAEATNELLDTITAESQLIRSRAGSMASTRHSGSLKRASKLVGRKKHLSEGGGELGLKMGEPTQRVRFGEGAVNLWESLDLMSSPDFLGARPRPSQPPLSSDSKQAGGTWRENDVCIQLTLSKVKLLYEIADGTIEPSDDYLSAPKAGTGRASEPTSTPPVSSRFMLFIQDIEVKDRIAASDINKMLYEYCTESMPKRSTQMLAIKNIATINPSDGCEECDLRVSLKPLRLNIDQDTLLFLIEFCTAFCKVLAKQQQQDAQQTQSSSSRPSGGASGQSGRADAQRANPSKLVDGISCLSGNGPARERAGETAARGGAEMRSDAKKKATSAGARAKQAQDSQSCSSSGGVSTASSLSAAQMSRGRSSKQQLATEPAATLARRDGAASGGGNFDRNGRVSNENDIAATTTMVEASGRKSGASCGGGSCVDSTASGGNDHNERQLEHDSQNSDEDYWESSEEMDDDEARATARLSEGDTERSDEEEYEDEEEEDANEEHDHEGASSDEPRAATTATSAGKRPLPTHCHTNDLSGAPNQQPIYIKSFTFSPDVPIRIDYHAKHLDFEQGALAGILMGLAHLDHSELILRRVQAKHGMRGLDRLLLFAINSWLSDIKRNQLPSILGGVGPMHSVIQLFQGMRDLVWMPIDHYRKDGRLVRGLQRGASSFSSSTAMAAINLVNRFISIVQCTAQIAHDIVTPPSTLPTHQARRLRAGAGARGTQSSSEAPASGPSGRRARHRDHARHLSSHDGASISHGASVASGALSGAAGLSQPRNFCEGVAVGFNIIKEGFNDTARNVTVGMQAEDMRSAVGELVRQIPSTLLNPIISATEGAQSVLVGIRNQIAPDARRDDQEKWKGRVRGK